MLFGEKFIIPEVVASVLWLNVLFWGVLFRNVRSTVCSPVFLTVGCS